MILLFRFHVATAFISLQFTTSTLQSSRDSVSFSNFVYQVKEPTYVDKTLLIKDILEDQGSKCVLSAPRGFGKTTNLQMLKAFFQVEVDKHGNKITSMKDPRKPIKDTPNFKLFQQTKIMKEKYFMDKHFGKYPVIHIDFKHTVSFTYLNETQHLFRDVLSETVSEHSYLKHSNQLDEEEKKFIILWSSDEYKSVKTENLTQGLEKLSKCLFKHFNKTKVVVLMDHYDSPILYCVAHPNIPQDVFNYVINVVQAIFHMHKDDFYVDTFLLTGIIQVEEPHSSKGQSIERYKFLQHHSFVPYFGFTEDEVSDLLGRYAIDVEKELLESVQSHYGGYRSIGGLTMHNPWAILNYLDRQRFDHVWAKRASIPNLQAILKIPQIHQKLERILKAIPVDMELQECLSSDDLGILREIVSDAGDVDDDRHSKHGTLFYSFLLDSGFLAYDTSGTHSVGEPRRYVIPNEEIKRFLWETLDE